MVEGVATVAGIAILAHDVFKAKTKQEKVEVAKGAVAGAPVGILLSEAGLGSLSIPIVAVEGTKILMKENVILESTQRAIGKTVVERGFNSSADDIQIIERLEIPYLHWRPFAPN